MIVSPVKWIELRLLESKYSEGKASGVLLDPATQLPVQVNDRQELAATYAMKHAAQAIAVGDSSIYINAALTSTVVRLNMQLAKGLNAPQLTQNEVEVRRRMIWSSAAVLAQMMVRCA